MKYRADIDGLRALAVLGVILFHAFPTLLTGGFVGVDVFFVISGYLISGIILRQQADGDFRLRDFYARRIRRIFPALVLVLAATLAIGWAILLDDEFALLGRQVAAGAGFAANILFWREAGYFDQGAELKPLLHLWSLGVEEQFYFVWPFLLLLCAGRRRWLPAMFAASFTVSMALNLSFAHHHPTMIFYLPFFRLWEFVAGAAVLLIDERPLAMPVRHALSLAGLAMLAASMWMFDSAHLHYPGRAALLPVAGTALLIAAGPAALVNRTALGLKPVAALGLVSYPLYLWHWPLISFLHVLGTTSPWAFTGALALSLALAVLTYLAIERPARRRPPARVVPTLSLLCLLMLLAGIAALAGAMKPRLHAVLGNVIAARHDWDWPPHAMTAATFGPFPIYVQRGTVTDEVLYIGDSNMQQYVPRIEEVIRSGRPTYTAVFMAQSGCRPIPGIIKDDRGDCLDVEGNVLRYLKTHRVRRVVIAGRWEPAFFTDELFYRFGKHDVVPLSDPRGRNAMIESFKSFVRRMRAEGVDVDILQNIPTDFDGRETVNTDNARLTPVGGLRHAFASFDPRVPRAQVVAEGPRRIIADIAAATGATVIDPVAGLCGGEFCPLVFGSNEFIYKDEKHLTARYAAMYATFMDDTILLPRSGLGGR